ncbi:IS481 family transposase [Enterovibrio paralichthyis]|uniref:IS481 family transposase n=1 Tax=Enterovibrio paralichthyis TaxID=2853805 RepID=UPI001C441475|nr:IS481 family transposase [Enterovibrio paralichthyis]MBV7297708.1 IS481 family transposase [Enterovibrio paralichthyis]
MQIKLHANATTTPKIRKQIQESDRPVATLAREFGIAESTVRRWKHRNTVEDGSHTKHNLGTTLSKAQEILVVELSKTLLLPLDDLLALTKEFINPDVSRSGLDRCLRRCGVGNLKALYPETEPKPSPKAFKAYEPGYVHIDIKYLPQMPDEPRRRYLYVAIDRATRWVYLQLLPDKTARTSRRFLKAVTQKAPFIIKTVLTDNGKEFTDRFCVTGQRQPTGNHQFDKECSEHDIEHRLISPGKPQTNGMVERFNGRVSDILKTMRFDCRDDLEATLMRYQYVYNHHIPQKALGHTAPIERLKKYYQASPELFRVKPINHRGSDT